MSRQPSPHNGRRGRFVPRPEALEDRCVPTCNFFVRGDTLTIQSLVTRRPHNETVIVSDNGGGAANNVVAFCGQAFFPNVPISRVVVHTGPGNDRVTYNLVGDLFTARRVDVDLGAGNDRFLAFLRRNILTGGNLSLNVNGGPGNDRLEAVMIGSLAPSAFLSINFDGGGGNNVLNVLSASFVNVAPGAGLSMNLIGNGTSDHVFAGYQGQMNGSIQVNATGGNGPGHVSADLELMPGSFGTVLPSRVVGGPEHDRLALVVHNPGTAVTDSLAIIGNGGGDSCVRTSNVIVFGCKTDRVVP